MENYHKKQLNFEHANQYIDALNSAAAQEPSQQAIENVRDHFLAYKLKVNFGDPDAYILTQIEDSHLALCDTEPNSIFIVAKQMVFHGDDLHSHSYLVFQYDMQGNFIEDYTCKATQLLKDNKFKILEVV